MIMMGRMDQRDIKVLRVILVEGLANLTVLIIKLVVGIGTGSLAVVSDAVHSLTDILNNIVAWFVTRHSVKPADSRHPYGHRKFETVAVFALAALLAILAFELAIRAITSETTEITTSRLELGLMLVVLTINIVISTWQRGWAKRLKSDILLADANHTLSDVLVTSSVIAGWQLSALGWIWMDQLIALAVAGLILYLAFSLFKRTLPVLLDERAIDPETLRSVVIGVDGVRAIRRVRSRWVGSTRAVDLIIEVDAKLPTEAAHEITDQLETLLAERFDVHDISIHVEPHN
ncbi:cation diffusion facilitator family transporter [Kaarinaea lacus]